MTTPINTDTNTAAPVKLKYEYVKPVVIEVGPDKIQFILKEAILRQSKFFDQACDRAPTVGAVYKLISASEVAVDAFKLFVDWLRDERIYISPLVWVADEEEGGARPTQNVYDGQTAEDVIKAHLSLLVAAYAFGHKIKDVLFRNAIIDRVMHIVRSTQYVLPLKFADTLSKLVSRPSTMEHLLVDYVAVQSDLPLRLGQLDRESFDHHFPFLIMQSRLVSKHLNKLITTPNEKGKEHYYDRIDVS